uniref:C1orf51 n=1 Tax=Osmerus mordax TaxID=8014 RepID=C1BLB4_OSMMO|nr:C1orf51 [Osmerus mordax]
MHSLGSSSKWPSYDSLPSTSSFLLSESDLTEDEADVFSSEGEGESVGSKASVGEGVHRLRLAFVDQDRFRAESSQAECRPHKATFPPQESPARNTMLGKGATSQGDLAFTKKCTELQHYIRPLVELLNGLKTGRFQRGLSSFQQSVAMDRLQRILGILQKPDMGEKYLRTLLQVEMMLKVWFPQVIREPLVHSTQNLRSSLPPRWHQNQLHIPVKKRKLSWLDSDFTSESPPHCKRLQPSDPHLAVPLREPATYASQPRDPRKPSEPRRADIGKESGGRTLEHDSCDARRLSHPCRRREKGGGKLVISPPSPCGSPATQDSCVSSTIAVADSPQIPLPVGKLPKCCSAPGTAQAEGGPAAMTSQEVWGGSPSRSASLKPLNQEEEGFSSSVCT